MPSGWRRPGFRMIVNNRPDGEDPRQPAGAAIESAARTAGMDYRAVPVGHAGVGPVEIAAMRQALADAKGPVLAYCRSGTRSTFVWAMAAAANGEDPAIIAVSAARAGHDVRPLLG